MASPLVDIGTGITIGFGTSGFTANIEDVTPPGSSREAVDTSHQGTTGGRTFIPADLFDNGECEFSLQFNPDTTPPIDQAIEEITITFPSGATWVFNGFMTAYTPGAPLDNKMVGDATVKVSGDINITAAT